MRHIRIRVGESVVELRRAVQQLIKAIEPYLTDTISLLPPLLELGDGGGYLLHDGGGYKRGNIRFHPQSLLLANGQPLLWADGREFLLSDARPADANVAAEEAIAMGISRPRAKLVHELTAIASLGTASQETQQVSA